MLRLEPRQKASMAMLYLTPVVAIFMTMLFGAILFVILGINPVEGIFKIFIEPFTDSWNHRDIVEKATPLILIATGLSLGFRAGVWNIGAEGQFIMGAVASGAVGLYFWEAEAVWLMPLMIVAGLIGGTLWAMIPAFLKIKFNANEILVSLMLVYVAQHFVEGMVVGPMQDPDGFGQSQSRNFSKNDFTELPMIVKQFGLHLGGVIALLGLAGTLILLQKHSLGFSIKLTGDSPRAARFAGVNPSLIIVICLGISGGLAGMAGMFELTGPAGVLSTNFSVNYGFTAIIVAFLGRLNPIGILFAGIVLAGTFIGGDIAKLDLHLPAAAVQMFQGMMLFFLLAAEILVNYRIRRVRRAV